MMGGAGLARRAAPRINRGGGGGVIIIIIIFAIFASPHRSIMVLLFVRHSVRDDTHAIHARSNPAFFPSH